MPNTYAFQPDYATAPGDTLKEVIEELGMSQSELALRTDLTEKTISLIAKGVAPITYETALKLEMVLGVPASVWNRLESNYRAYCLAKKEGVRMASAVEWLNAVPIRELVNRGQVADVADKGQLVHNALSFFGVSSVDAWDEVWLKPQVQFRGSKAHTKYPGYVAAWIRLGDLAAQAVQCGPYDRVSFRRAIQEVRGLTTLPAQQAINRARTLCAQAGVAFVVVREIPKASVSGATRWLSKSKAVIMLSLKYKSDDQFWFSFFHEAGHVYLHGKKAVFIDDGMSEESDEEIEANKFARELLIPPRYERQLPHLKTKRAISRFASEIGVAPGIVVGRLQREKFLPQSHCNDLKVKYDWK